MKIPALTTSSRLLGHLQAVLTCAALAGPAALPAGEPSRLEKLEVISGGYPRAFYFRLSEDLARYERLPYDVWEKTFLPLGGVQIKALDEEIPGPNQAIIDYATRFKQRHPEKMVLLHYNAHGRDPQFDRSKFFAGHWVYYNGSRTLSDIPAEPGETDIVVEDTELFRMDVGRVLSVLGKDLGPRNAPDDIGLCLLDANGKPDWNQSEQVQLIAIDPARKTIRVRRGCYGTAPRAFPAGKAYAAAHSVEGPWGEVNLVDGGDFYVMKDPQVRAHPSPQCNLMWTYNFSTKSPRDSQGRQCIDVLVDEFASFFGPGGRLAAFDGVEFDVSIESFQKLLAARHSMKGKRRGDLNGDGLGDDGLFDGMDTYGQGLFEFYDRMGKRLGKDRLVLADSNVTKLGPFDSLNGMEIEGFSRIEKSGVSAILNKLRAFRQFGRAPAFSYLNHKEWTNGKKWSDVPFQYHRYVMATMIMADAAITHFASIKPGAGELFGTFDELQKGTEYQYGWLGHALGDAIPLAARGRNLLDGADAAKLLSRVVPVEGTAISLAAGAIQVAATEGLKKPQAADAPSPWPDHPDLLAHPHLIGFQLKDIPVPEAGTDLFVRIRSRGQAPTLAPAKNYRRAASVSLVDPNTKEPMKTTAFVDQEWFESTYAFAQLSPGTKALEFAVEGTEPAWIDRIEVYAHQNVMLREFEHGVVLVNMSERPYTFDLEKLTPGKRYRRLSGSLQQDPQTNNGSPITGPVTLHSRDGLFLVRTD